MPKDILNILGVEVAPGKGVTVTFEVAKLHTRNTLEVPIIIERSKKPGPTVLMTAGIHGDEVNGVEIVRQIIAKGISQYSARDLARIQGKKTADIAAILGCCPSKVVLHRDDMVML